MLRHIITAFKEYKTFDLNKPYSITKITFQRKITTPPHYADTIEILLCFNISGDCYIGGEKYSLGGKQLFFIAPNVIHSMNYQPNSGSLYVIKIYPLGLNRYLNLNSIFSDSMITWSDIPNNPSGFQTINELSKKLQDDNNNITEKMIYILQIFDCFIKQINLSDISKNRKVNNNTNIYKILNWTEEHYNEAISIDDISSQLGYTKNYFCNKFKALTGTTYIDYLNHVRISHACELLKDERNIPLEQISEECGFTSVSYFITTFKKALGITPHAYRSKQ